MAMTLEELIGEGEALARPSLVLTRDGDGPVVGFLGGERVDHPNAVPAEAIMIDSQEHLITIDTEPLQGVGIPVNSASVGVVEVTLTRGDDTFRVLESDRPATELARGGEPLHAQSALSFPPLAAVCLYGSDRVAQWLADNGLERHDYLSAEVLELGAEYADVYVDRSPVILPGVDAVVGGWHDLWSDDDFYYPLEMRRAVLTLPEAGPVRELWRVQGGPNWRVRQHFD